MHPTARGQANHAAGQWVTIGTCRVCVRAIGSRHPRLQAEYHFRRALSINDRSSVLRCYLGMALHKLKRNSEALDMLGQVRQQLVESCCARFRGVAGQRRVAMAVAAAAGCL